MFVYHLTICYNHSFKLFSRVITTLPYLKFTFDHGHLLSDGTTFLFGWVDFPFRFPLLFIRLLFFIGIPFILIRIILILIVFPFVCFSFVCFSFQYFSFVYFPFVYFSFVYFSFVYFYSCIFFMRNFSFP